MYLICVSAQRVWFNDKLGYSKNFNLLKNPFLFHQFASLNQIQLACEIFLS